jgi:hypothetical protein
VNSQDYALKPQRNCTFMNSASGWTKIYFFREYILYQCTCIMYYVLYIMYYVAVQTMLRPCLRGVLMYVVVPIAKQMKICENCLVLNLKRLIWRD